MFLVREQNDRIENYNRLDAQVRADLTFRLLKKLKAFLDDFKDVNRVLDVIPFQSQKKAFKEEHIDLVFDLVERVLAGLDVAPVIGGNVLDPDDAGNRYVFKGFAVEAVDGNVSRYSATRPATPDEIALNDHLKERITQLNLFVSPSSGIPGPEFRPREYFDGLVETAERAGLKPLFEDEEE